MRLARAILIASCIASCMTTAEQAGANDDATCKGAVRGTPAYAQCRSQLAQRQHPGRHPTPTDRNGADDRPCSSPTNEPLALLDLLRGVIIGTCR
jgi:hypothetical protein